MIILVDIDEVVADLLTTWLECYNVDWHDDLTREDITDWELAKFVKPECGRQIYNYIQDKNIDLYYAVVPVLGALDGIDLLRILGHRVVFVTSEDFKGNKFDWLTRYGFTDCRRDYVVSVDKNLIRGDILIDDNCDNVANFRNRGFLFTAPWNTKYKLLDELSVNQHYNRNTRVYGWKDIVSKIKMMEV